MYRNRKKIAFVFPLFIIAAALVSGLIVMVLWNFIFPSVLHTEPITYWQAVALLILCRILFFGFNRGYKNRKPDVWRNPAWRQKWMNMNDEERSRFREEWKRRCRRPNE